MTELYQEFLKYYEEREYEKAKKPLLQILEIWPDDKNTKDNLKSVEGLSQDRSKKPK